MLKISEAALSVGSSSSTRLQRPLEFHSVRKPSWWSFSNNKTPQKTLGKSETETAAETVSAAVLEKDSSLLVWRCCCPSAAGVVVDQLPRTIKGTPSVSVLVEARLILKVDKFHTFSKGDFDCKTLLFLLGFFRPAAASLGCTRLGRKHPVNISLKHYSIIYSMFHTHTLIVCRSLTNPLTIIISKDSILFHLIHC